jgi:nucleotide-binding universal stress UspA family protein
MSKLGRRFAELGTDISARVLRASLSATRTRVETCTPAEGIVTQANKSDLVLVGRRRTFPWFLAPLARYARRLLRRSRAPMLIVGARPTGAYRNVVIATDLATDIRPALKWARHIAPGASFTLLHVYRGLFESKLQWAAVPDKHIFEHRLAAQRQAEMGMAALANQHRSDNVGRALIAHGSPVQDVLRKARELGADLIVVVKTTHSWWAELVAASASVEIATRADQDVLVVHGASSRTSSVHSEEAERRT